MSTINRNVIIVTPQQPFLDWLLEVDPDNADFTLETVQHEPSAYLLP